MTILTRRQATSILCAIALALLAIFAKQVQANVVAIPDVYQPYVLAVVAILSATLIPDILHQADGQPVPDQKVEE